MPSVINVMDKDGMLPSHWKCRDCGLPLNDNGMQPAELYAGTYTGLCHKCESTGPRIVKIYNLDSALEVSYPPSCPSWRRDREDYTAYFDCNICEGKGRVVKSRHRHKTFCMDCLNRFVNNPVRVMYSQLTGEIRDRYQNEYLSLLSQMSGIKLTGKDKVKLGKWIDSNKLIVDVVAQEHIDRAKHEMAIYDSLKDTCESYVRVNLPVGT